MSRPEVPILHVDDDVVVVNKPAGLVVHRGWANERHVVMTLVRDALGSWVYPVHRLDRQTSGVLVFARHPDAQRTLSASFAEQAVEKRYLAMVRGRLETPGTIDYAIPRDEDGERVPAVTDYEPILAIPHYTFVFAIPRTGRLHQIRRHFKHVDHPIVMDKKHGRGIFNQVAERDLGIVRMALHARSLVFPHPRTNEPLSFVAPVVDLGPAFGSLGLAAEHWA